MLKKCIFCTKDFTDKDNGNEALGVCSSCQPWKKKNIKKISDHRKLMITHFSSEIRDRFEKRTPLEQGYIVLRSMENNLNIKMP